MTSWPIYRTLRFHLFLSVWPFIIWLITNWTSSPLIDLNWNTSSMIGHSLICIFVPASSQKQRSLFEVACLHHPQGICTKWPLVYWLLKILLSIPWYFHLHWYSMTCGKEFPVDNGNKRHRKNALADRTVPCIGTMTIMMRIIMIVVVGDYT